MINLYVVWKTFRLIRASRPTMTNAIKDIEFSNQYAAAQDNEFQIFEFSNPYAAALQVF